MTSDPSGVTQLGEALVLHETVIRRFLAARSGDPELAQDLFQELWVKVSRLPAMPIANPRSYLLTMANNLVADSRRRSLRAHIRDAAWLAGDNPERARAPQPIDPVRPADDMLADRQEHAMLHRVIADLPSGARRAIILHRIEELSQAEVAVAMGISRSGVEKHIAVAMKHLRTKLLNWRKQGSCGDLPGAASGHHKDDRESSHD